jgi:hypothetical protein
MPNQPKTPLLPSRRQLLLASLLLFAGIFAALKSAFDYTATGTWSGYWVAAALLGLALGGQTLRQLTKKS